MYLFYQSFMEQQHERAWFMSGTHLPCSHTQGNEIATVCLADAQKLPSHISNLKAEMFENKNILNSHLKRAVSDVAQRSQAPRWAEVGICIRSGKGWVLGLTWQSRLLCLLGAPQQVRGTKKAWDRELGKGSTEVRHRRCWKEIEDKPKTNQILVA